MEDHATSKRPRLSQADETSFERDIQAERRAWKPRVPKVLENNTFSIVAGSETTSVADQEKVKALFPHTYGQKFIQFVQKLGSRPMSPEREPLPDGSGWNDQQARPSAFQPLRIGVVLSGGQAAGGHNCICGLYDYIHTYAPGSTLYGFLGGPKAICDNRTKVLDPETINRYRNMGGFDMLTAGRDKIETEEQFAAARATATALGLDGIVVIGGDDSNTNAAVLGENFLAHNLPTKVIGLPKTIDGDLKNEHIEVSFGFDTAAKVYAECVGNIQVDTVSTSKYYHFVRLMGREASHLTLEVALQCRPNVTLISEEIRAKAQSLESIVKDLADLVVQRAAAGKRHGVILLPEGLIDFIPEFKPLIEEINEVLAKGVEPAKVVDELSEAQRKTMLFLPAAIQEQLLLDRDPHGNVQVAKIESERLLALAVKKEIEARRAAGSFIGGFETQCHYFGYEGRCALPSDFDSEYCYALGLTAGALLANGYTCMMAAIQKLTGPVKDWEVRGVPLTAMFNIERRKGKDKPVIKKALTELGGEPFLFFQQHRDSWRLEDQYVSPGPIQFAGPSRDVVTATLQLEQKHRDLRYPGVVAERRSSAVPTPKCLSVPFLGLQTRGELPGQPRVDAAVAAGLPKLGKQPIVEAVEALNNPHRATAKIGVVFSGRQCPGAHSVVAGIHAFVTQRTPGGSVVGFRGGTAGLVSGEVVPVDDALLARYANQGGMDMFGRTKDLVKPGEFGRAMEVCANLGLTGLVVVGGPASNGIAARLAEHFLANGSATTVTSVPAMIDGDMVGRYVEATVGFETSTLCYSQLIGNLCTDAASARKYYYFVRVMGRSASHTALECALQTKPTMCLISEEIEAHRTSLHELVGQIADVVEARAVDAGLNYGVILVPEGIVEAIAELKLLLREVAAKGGDVSKLTAWARAVLEELPASIQQQFLLKPEDSTGSAQVNNIETERLLAELVGAEMKRRKAGPGAYSASFAPVCFYLGYQARSSLPSLFDCALGSSLGYAAGLLCSEGRSGYCATVHNTTKPVAEWSVGGVPLSTMLHTTPAGGIALSPTLVDLGGNSFNEFSRQRASWAKADHFRNPGPIQFDEETRPLSILQDTAGMARLREDVARMCDQVKASCGVGASADYLHTAQVQLSALQKVLGVVGKNDLFREVDDVDYVFA